MSAERFVDGFGGNFELRASNPDKHGEFLAGIGNGNFNIGGWRSQASCKGTNPEIFFQGGQNAAYKKARAVCAGCPDEAKTECLAYSISQPVLTAKGEKPVDGLFGNTSPTERGRLRASMIEEGLDPSNLDDARLIAKKLLAGEIEAPVFDQQP